MQPGMASFHHPSPCWVSLRIARLRCWSIQAYLRDMDLVTTSLQLRSRDGIVIAVINAYMHPFVRVLDHNRIENISDLSHIMPVRRAYRCRQRNAVAVGQDISLDSRLSAVGGIVTDFFGDNPFFTIPGALPRAASKDCQSQSIPCKSSYRSRSTVHSLAKTPDVTSIEKCLWQVEPELNSLGTCFHGQPLRSTYTIPSRILRSDIGGLPPGPL
jgi:hypothetical protein